MSEDTKQLLGVLVALSPWIAFVVFVAWSSVASLRKDRRRHLLSLTRWSSRGGFGERDSAARNRVPR